LRGNYHDYDSQRSGKDARTSDCVGDRSAAYTHVVSIDPDTHCTWFYHGTTAPGGDQSPGEHELDFRSLIAPQQQRQFRDVARHAARFVHVSTFAVSASAFVSCA
jgi:hypothetical protein